MSSKLTLKIKDFPTRGGSITFKITSANIGQKIIGSTSVPKLVVTRKWDYYSHRFLMLAILRRAKPNDQGLWLPQLTITNDKFDADGKFLSGTTIDFFDAVVETIMPNGSEEEITFLADRKSGDFMISNVEVWFD
jgi:hypothetical protein